MVNQIGRHVVIFHLAKDDYCACNSYFLETFKIILICLFLLFCFFIFMFFCGICSSVKCVDCHEVNKSKN